MDVQLPQLLWAINSLLIVIVTFMIKNWVAGINIKFDGVIKKMDCKQDIAVCKERYPILKANNDALFKHKHPFIEGAQETGGVVIP